MSSNDSPSPYTEVPPTLSEYTEPPRVGYPLIAWIVIVALVALTVWGQYIRNDHGSAAAEVAADPESFVFELQGRYSIGAVNSGLPIKDSQRRQFFAQLEKFAAHGNRLRLVVAAGEIVGPQQALDVLIELPEKLRDLPEVQTLKRLYEYGVARNAPGEPLEALTNAGSGDAEAPASQPSVAPEITPAEREALVKRLGWFGQLALAQRGLADKAARDAALAPAVKTFGFVIGAFGIGCVAALLGFVMLVALLVLAAQGSLRGLQTGSAFGGV